MSPSARPVRSVQRLLVYWLLGLSSILLVVGAAFDYIDDATLVKATFDQVLGDDAVAIAEHTHASGLGLAKHAQTLLGARRKGDKTYYRIVEREGEAPIGDVDLPSVEDNAGRSMIYRDADYRGDPVRLAVYRAQTPDGPRLVAVAETLNARHRMLRGTWLRDTATNLTMFVLTALAAWFCVRRGLASLLRLRDQVSARLPDDLSPLPESQAPAEARPLVAALNRQIARTLTATQAQQRFVADAAHQLRTPLAGLQTQLEVMLRASPEDDAWRGRLLAIHESSRRLTRTANQLLALARAEATSLSREEFTTIDMRDLIESCIGRALTQAVGRGLDLGANLHPATVRGIPWQLDELLSNLIDNAMAYTPAGGRITVACGIDETRHPYLHIADDGPGIPPEERERVFERFYRVKGTASTGSGLGLAIVRDVAHRHGAQIAIANTDGGRGSEFRVRFPPPPST